MYFTITNRKSLPSWREKKLGQVKVTYLKRGYVLPPPLAFPEEKRTSSSSVTFIENGLNVRHGHMEVSLDTSASSPWLILILFLPSEPELSSWHHEPRHRLHSPTNRYWARGRAGIPNTLASFPSGKLASSSRPQKVEATKGKRALFHP